MKKLLLFLFAAVTAILLTVTCSADDMITVVLDPGHGGHDPGTIVGTRYESAYINDVTALLKGYLEETGKFKVVLTRGENEYKKYLARALVADSVDADILISLHFNSGDTPYKNGVEVLSSVLDEWYPAALVRSITSSISSECGLADLGAVRKADTGDERGIYYWHSDMQWDIPGKWSTRKSDYYSMISWGTKLGFPAIIVEHAYLSNAGDLAFCDSDGAMEKLARAEADAIIAHYTGHTHTYGEVTVDRVASCCLGGVSSRKCTVCGHRTEISRTPADPSNHGWTEESKNATCTADGYISRECQIARNLREKGLPTTPEHTYYEKLPAYGHDVRVDFERVAAHGVDGYKKESCSRCGEVWEYYTAGEAHTYVCEAEISCSLTSSELAFTCTVCGDTQMRTVEIPPHTLESVSRTDPTCTADGSESFVCTVCDYETTEALTRLGHDFGETLGEVGCDFDKTEVTYTCARCDESVTEKVEIPPHDFVLEGSVSPSCTENGSESFVCSVCGIADVRSIDALGHEYGEAEVKREAGYFRKGELAYACIREGCAEVKTEAIAKKDGSIFAIIGAVACIAAVICALCLILIKGAKKRITETADEAGAILESTDTAEKNAEAEETQETEKIEEELTK